MKSPNVFFYAAMTPVRTVRQFFRNAKFQNAILNHIMRIVIHPALFKTAPVQILDTPRAVCRIPVDVIQLRTVELIVESQLPARFFQIHFHAGRG